MVILLTISYKPEWVMLNTHDAWTVCIRPRVNWKTHEQDFPSNFFIDGEKRCTRREKGRCETGTRTTISLCPLTETCAIARSRVRSHPAWALRSWFLTDQMDLMVTTSSLVVTAWDDFRKLTVIIFQPRDIWSSHVSILRARIHKSVCVSFGLTYPSRKN